MTNNVCLFLKKNRKEEEILDRRGNKRLKELKHMMFD